MNNDEKTERSAASAVKHNASGVLIAITLLLVLVAGFGFMGMQIQSMQSSQEEQNEKIGKVENKISALEELQDKGASDELLGFDTVDKDGYQAIFLNSGQVYFGKITEMSTQNFVLEDIFYLREEGAEQSLVKLGCELHKPEDKMTIVRSSIEFWENLSDSSDQSSVVGAIDDYKTAFPSGQECAS